MTIGPFLNREATTSARDGSARTARAQAAALMLVASGFLFWFWDRMGWDRASVRGAAEFARALFGLSAAGAVFLAMSDGGTVAVRIASMRDKRSLDVLLSSGYTNLEIVLGTLAAECLRAVNRMTALIPFAVAAVYAGGIDPAWILIAAAAIFGGWFASAGIGLAASVRCATAARAVSAGAAILLAWILVPMATILLKSLLWPSAPDWIVEAAVFVVRTGPAAIPVRLANLAVFGTLAETIARMAAWEVAIGIAGTAYAAARLRSDSRRLHDIAVLSARERIRRLVAAVERRPRPPCGDDPVYWQTAFGERRTIGQRIAGAGLFLLLTVGYVDWLRRFLPPAWSETMRNGRGPSAGLLRMPDPDPFLLVLMQILRPDLQVEMLSGTARLSFNIAIRQLTAFALTMVVFGLIGGITQAVAAERRRDTWDGLLATPLTGVEILRGLFLGSARNMRGVLGAVVAAWVLGLAAGSLHPAAFALGLVGSTLILLFFGLLALESSVAKRLTTAGAPAHPILGPIWLFAWTVMTPALPAFFAFVTLLSHDDVAAARAGRPFLTLAAWSRYARVPAGRTMLVWGAVAASLALIVLFQIRYLRTNFDAIVGRPTRGATPRPDLSAPSPRAEATPPGPPAS